MRIKVRQHPANGVGDQFFVLNRLDIALLDRRKDIGEIAQFLNRQGSRCALCGTRGKVNTKKYSTNKAKQHQTNFLQLAAHRNSDGKLWLLDAAYPLQWIKR